MYEFDNLAIARWYLVDAEDVSFDRETAIIGGTGAGKSTLLDAMKTVVSGNNRNVLDLNSAAGDRQDRTVRDYCLGCVTDVNGGKPARERCETTLAMSFVDSETGHAISIGVMLVADKDQQGEETKRFVADGYAFRIADFVERREDGNEYTMSHDAMVAKMRAKLGAKRFDTFQQSSRYVADYLQRMRPRNPPDAKTFLRSFGNALRAKEIKDPTSFVRNFVLEALPTNIKRVQESIGLWRELEDEVKRLEVMLQALRVIRGRFNTGFSRRLELETATFMEKHLTRLDLECLAEDYREGREKAKAVKLQGEELVAEHTEELRILNEELLSLRTTLNQSASAARQEALRGQMGAVSRHLATLCRAIGKDIGVYADMADINQIRERIPSSCQAALRAAVELSTLVAGRQPQDWLGEADRVLALASSATDMASAARSLDEQRRQMAVELAEMEAREREMRQQVGRVETGGAVYSLATSEFIAELERAGIDAVPLPEVVEVSEPDWAFALEALLGANREALIVPQIHLERAFDILYRNRSRFHSCRLVNTRRTRGSGTRPPPHGSISEIVRTDNEDARAFIDYNVGRYVRAEGAVALEKMEFGITREGKTHSGLSKRVYRDQEPILGKTAQARRREALRREYDGLRKAIGDRKLDYGKIDKALKRIEAVSAVDAGALAAQIADVRTSVTEVESLGRQSDAIDTADVRHLKEEIARTERNIAENTKDLKRAHEQVQQGEVSAKLAEQNLMTTLSRISELQTAEAALREAQEGECAMSVVPLIKGAQEMTIANALVVIDTQLNFKPEYRSDTRAFFKKRIAELQAEIAKPGKSPELGASYHLERAIRALAEFCHEYYGRNPLVDAVDPEEQFLWLVKKEDEIENNELKNQKDNVTEARRSVEVALKEDLLTKMGENFERLDVQLKVLNERLGQYTFVGQKYVFTKSPNAAMRPLYDLVRKLAASPERGLLGFLPAEDGAVTDSDEVMAEAMAQIEKLVTSADINTADFEDYRKYFEFELNLDSGDRQPPIPFSSIEGKLSGGQRQAPYYVAIAASMVSAYYPRARGGDTMGMGLVVFDEAFNKLDIPNTQELMRLFHSLGLQVVVAAPEEKRASLRECVDTIVNVNRLPHSPDVFIDTVRLGEAAKVAMLRENPAHAGIEAFRERATAVLLV